MRLARLATTGLLTGGLLLGAAACGSSSTGGSSGGQAAPPPAPASSANSAPIASIDQLKGQDTAVALDPQLLPTLTSLKVTPKPTGNAKLTMEFGGPTLDFPITGGHVKIFDKSVTPYVQGSIEHQNSGLSFTAGGKTLTVENFVVDPGTSMLTAEVKEMNGAKIPLFNLDGSSLQITPGMPTKLDGTKVTLTGPAADAMNQYFGVQAFKEGIPIGTAHIRAS